MAEIEPRVGQLWQHRQNGSLIEIVAVGRFARDGVRYRTRGVVPTRSASLYPDTLGRLYTPLGRDKETPDV